MYPQTRHPVSGGGGPAGSAPARAPRSCSHFLIVVRRAAAAAPPGRGWLLRVAPARCAAVPVRGGPGARPASRGYGRRGGGVGGVSERSTPPPAAAPHRRRPRRGTSPGRFGHRAAAAPRAGGGSAGGGGELRLRGARVRGRRPGGRAGERGRLKDPLLLACRRLTSQRSPLNSPFPSPAIGLRRSFSFCRLSTTGNAAYFARAPRGLASRRFPPPQPGGTGGRRGPPGGAWARGGPTAAGRSSASRRRCRPSGRGAFLGAPSRRVRADFLVFPTLRFEFFWVFLWGGGGGVWMEKCVAGWARPLLFFKMPLGTRILSRLGPLARFIDMSSADNLEVRRRGISLSLGGRAPCPQSDK